MSEVKEYYYKGDYVYIWDNVTGKPDMVIVCDGSDYGELHVVHRDELINKEDSWTFQQKQKQADDLRLVTAKAEENFNKITEKVIKAACSSLSTRMKMNILFKDGMNADGWAITIANELNKLVREDAPKIIKGNNDIEL